MAKKSKEPKANKASLIAEDILDENKSLPETMLVLKHLDSIIHRHKDFISVDQLKIKSFEKRKNTLIKEMLKIQSDLKEGINQLDQKKERIETFYMQGDPHSDPAYDGLEYDRENMRQMWFTARDFIERDYIHERKMLHSSIEEVDALMLILKSSSLHTEKNVGSTSVSNTKLDKVFDMLDKLSDRVSEVGLLQIKVVTFLQKQYPREHFHPNLLCELKGEQRKMGQVYLQKLLGDGPGVSGRIKNVFQKPKKSQQDVGDDPSNYKVNIPRNSMH